MRAPGRRLMRAGERPGAPLIGVQGSHQINNSLAVLRAYYDADARYMTLTHSYNIDWADSATAPPAHHRLTLLGASRCGTLFVRAGDKSPHCSYGTLWSPASASGRLRPCLTFLVSRC